MALLNLKEISPHIERNQLIKITGYKENVSDKFVTYFVQCTVGNCTWTVSKRYSNFKDFDEIRFPDRKKSFLPPKKVFGNRDTEFLTERKIELEKYLRAVAELEIWLAKKHQKVLLPKLFARFLDFHQYEVHSIVEDICERLSIMSKIWITENENKPRYFEFTAIEMHAIGERLKLPLSPTKDEDDTGDVSHVMEFLTTINNVKIKGAKGFVDNSNIISHSLALNLHFCRKLTSLWITDCDVRVIAGIDKCKHTLKRLTIHYSMKNLKDLLCKDDTKSINEITAWTTIEHADFSFNECTEIDGSIQLLKSLQKLNFSHNQLESIGSSLHHLMHLTDITLTNNCISTVENWHLKLGNVKNLNLSGNDITNLNGLGKLFSLQSLNLSENLLGNIESIMALQNLPVLENLILKGNKIQKIVDYRAKVLHIFGQRFVEVTLDNVKSDSAEIDTITIRLALNKLNEERHLENKKKEERQNKHNTKDELKVESEE
uniref:PX domain-containing protein n=1 Tax=Rhabditophanes sp. KR3021 TaxID=114890 RepID=A0AC35U5V7_9BILA